MDGRRALLLLALVCACDRPSRPAGRDTGDAIARLMDLGATQVDVDANGRIVRVNLSGTAASDEDLRHLEGLVNLEGLALAGTEVSGVARLRGLAKLAYLNLDRTRLTDRGLAPVAELPGLRSLYVGSDRLSDAGLAHLASLTGLRSLFLRGSRITDRGLAHLRRLGKLEALVLFTPRVTDTGLDHVAALGGLTFLQLAEAEISDAGVERIKLALPDCEVVR
jgi:hypothetical protein